MPTFSVVVTAYKNDQFLPACLQSIADQTMPDWECIVVNDASPDDTSSIAHEFAKKDDRFKVLDLEVNGGLHLARRAGVEACRGDYVIFLDADDDFSADGLEQMAVRLAQSPYDMAHFGIKVIPDGADEKTCASFEDNVNADQPVLERDDLLRIVFTCEGGYARDWRVTQRAYSLSLARSAFAAMTDKRLERAEDCYEYLVLASKAKSEVSFNDIRLLNYHYGRGITGTRRIDGATFARFCEKFRDCVDAINGYAGSGLSCYAAGSYSKLMDLLMNDWLVRVANSEKEKAAGTFAVVFGNDTAAVQLMRLARDAAYELYSNNKPFNEKSDCAIWYTWADSFASCVSGEMQKEFTALRAQTCGHLFDLERRSAWCVSDDACSPTIARRRDHENQDIRIFVTTHKDVDLYHSNILQPVQVGAKNPRRRLLWAFQDDTGDNISLKNAMYCELTTQYWAWKNVDARYYGFCHYRRYFDFSAEEHEENPYGEVMDGYIDWGSQKRYGLDDKTIAECVSGFDIVTTGIKDLENFPEKYSSPYDHYSRAPYLKIADLDRVLAIVKELHPDYSEDVDSYISGHFTCFCNMYIMRKELFFRYCEWMFPILDEFCMGWDTSKLSHETLRTPGHLSERLFNIWLTHEKRINPALKHKQLQCVHFEHPEHLMEPVLDPADSKGKPAIPVVFAADNNYVPMVTTTVCSMLENASKNCFYDVVILEKDFTEHNRHVMRSFFSRYENACVRFVNVAGMVKAYDLQTSNEHISVETYYRFLIQKVLPGYDKVLYLDSDLIVRGDVAELYATELGDNLLGAAHDIDYLGNLNMNDGERMKYTQEVLGLKDPYGYFQAGVLLLNTAEMRRLYPFQKWLEIAAEPKYIYDDQDILNAHCQGRVTYLDNAWNVMNDCGGRIKKVFSFAPADVYDAYMAAYSTPKILHYAGFEKPWKLGFCDQAELYWFYARQTPFYETMLDMVYPDRGDLAVECAEVERRVTTPERAVSEDSPLRKVFDGVLPQGSHRREIAKATVRTLRGRH